MYIYIFNIQLMSSHLTCPSLYYIWHIHIYYYILTFLMYIYYILNNFESHFSLPKLHPIRLVIILNSIAYAIVDYSHVDSDNNPGMLHIYSYMCLYYHICVLHTFMLVYKGVSDFICVYVGCKCW